MKYVSIQTIWDLTEHSLVDT